MYIPFGTRALSRSSMYLSAITNRIPRQIIHPQNPNAWMYYGCAGSGSTLTLREGGRRNIFTVYRSYPGMTLGHLVSLTQHWSFAWHISFQISPKAGWVYDSLHQ